MRNTSTEPAWLEGDLWLREEEAPEAAANRGPDRHAENEQEAPRHQLRDLALGIALLLPQLAWMVFLVHQFVETAR